MRSYVLKKGTVARRRWATRVKKFFWRAFSFPGADISTEGGGAPFQVTLTIVPSQTVVNRVNTRSIRCNTRSVLGR